MPDAEIRSKRRSRICQVLLRQVGRKFNERTGTPFNYLEVPTDIVFEIALCRLRYNLSLRNLAEMFLLRGWEFIHEAVRCSAVGRETPA
jgi:hypothetical protein